MERFEVYSNDVLVGHSILESGDPPMGVAFGEFLPNAAYSGIEGECKTNHADQSALRLSVRTSTGVEVECVGVGILDYSAEIDPPYVEVNVLGIPYPLYGELLPHHVARYEQQFSEIQSKSGFARGGA